MRLFSTSLIARWIVYALDSIPNLCMCNRGCVKMKQSPLLRRGTLKPHSCYSCMYIFVYIFFDHIDHRSTASIIYTTLDAKSIQLLQSSQNAALCGSLAIRISTNTTSGTFRQTQICLTNFYLCLIYICSSLYRNKRE